MFEMRATVIQLSILLAACIGRSHGQNGPAGSSEPFLASVRAYPEGVHLCMSTFISPEVLLATAVCLLCILEECKFFVMTVKNRLDDPTVPIYDVKKTIIHPSYDGTSVKYDVGLLFLEGTAINVKIMKLPPPFYKFSGVNATVYECVYHPQDRIFHVLTKQVATVSNKICSYIHSEAVPSRFLCTYSEQSLALGHEDHGSPVISMGTYILGIYPYMKMRLPSRVERFQSIFPNINWIKSLVPSLLRN